jgi:hypothetical protein
MNYCKHLEWFHFIEDAVDDICDLLEIEFPIISFDNECLPTKTTMAGYGLDNGVMSINPDYCKEEAKGLILFSVAHELRHKWQSEYQPKMVSKRKYKVRDSKTSLNKYNSQDAEVDANAFALWYIWTITDSDEVMENYLNILVQGGSDEKAILNRLGQVIDEMIEKEGIEL